MKKQKKSKRITTFLVFLLCIAFSSSIIDSKAATQKDQSFESFQITKTKSPKPQQSPQLISEFWAIDVRGWGLNSQELYFLSSLEGRINANKSELFVVINSGTYQWL